MTRVLQRIATSSAFHRATLALIMANAVVMGLETWPAVAGRFPGAFAFANTITQTLFITELAIRIGAHGRRPLAFFRNGWNVFDFTIVALSLLPAAGPFATVARLARILRVARMVSGMPDLRLIIGTMLRSIPSMGHVVLLLGILIYVYGVVGCHLFAAADPEHWGSLGRAARTLFVIITLEGWVELLEASAAATPWAWLYYGSFIVIAVFVVTNLFIAVVINNLEKVRAEDAAPVDRPTPAVDLAQLVAELEHLTDQARRLRDEGAEGAAFTAENVQNVASSPR